MSELKKCPFCNGEVCLEIGYDDETPMEFWTIKSTKTDSGCTCEDIFIESYYFDEENEKEDAKRKLIKAWNTRTPVERIIERLEEDYVESRNSIDIEKDFYLGMCQGLQYAINHIREEMQHD